MRRWLRHKSPAQIARDTNYAQASVDRYIAGYQRVRLLAQKVSSSVIPSLTGLSAGVVGQYIALLLHYEPNLLLHQPVVKEETLVSVS